LYSRGARSQMFRNATFSIAISLEPQGNWAYITGDWWGAGGPTLENNLQRLRNIGISAHIDSGKTTLTERILFYTRRIHRMHEVHGEDGGATMDYMDLERERGITINSAATYCQWRGHQINIIDTPGHVDFTMEVERSLRVLDGAILVLCAVGGVQSQSLTVDRQMRRYGVARLAFINKCDREGADPQRVCRQIRQRLNLNPVLIQLPIGLGAAFEGVIDLIEMRALFFRGEAGERVEAAEIPASLQSAARAARESMLDAVSMFSEELTQAWLEGRADPPAIKQALRQAVLRRQLLPVLLGSAYRNKGIQPLLDAVVDFLPSPEEITTQAYRLDTEDGQQQAICLSGRVDDPLVAMAFKLQESRFGPIAYLRIYQGRLERETQLMNCRTGKFQRPGRLALIHADRLEEIRSAHSGQIVGVFGLETQNGDTFTDGRLRLSFSAMQVPEPVISLGVKPAQNQQAQALANALQRFAREDPSFRVSTDAESGQLLIAGMGELQLEVYLERVRREYGIEVQTSPPEVAYRETITREVEFDYTHKKQTGGAGQYGRIIGRLQPAAEVEFEFVDQVKGGAVPAQFIPAVEKGFAEAVKKGPLIGAPVVGVRVILEDGASHPVDSKEIAFRQAAYGAWRESIGKAGARLLEPIMRVEVETPPAFLGKVLGSLNQRRAMIIGQEELGQVVRVEADVPLAEMFGYATVLRSLSEGQAAFTMQFSRYLHLPEWVAEKLLENNRQREGA